MTVILIYCAPESRMGNRNAIPAIYSTSYMWMHTYDHPALSVPNQVARRRGCLQIDRAVLVYMIKKSVSFIHQRLLTHSTLHVSTPLDKPRR